MESKHDIAKKKLDGLTRKLEISIYQMKYGSVGFEVLTPELYDRVLDVCYNYSIIFPLIMIEGEVYLNGSINSLFCILTVLADTHSIVINYDKIYYP